MLRWLISRTRLLRPSSRPLESPSRVAGEDAGAVAAERARGLDEGGEPGAGGPAEPGVQVRGRQRRVLERVEQAELVVEQEAR
jgi:hypothetical protein